MLSAISFIYLATITPITTPPPSHPIIITPHSRSHSHHSPPNCHHLTIHPITHHPHPHPHPQTHTLPSPSPSIPS